MRKALLLMTVLGFVGLLWAADPIVGSWKLNLAKSKFAPNDPAPKKQTEVYRETTPGQIELTYKNTQADGASNLLIISIPAQGGVNKRLRGDNGGAMEVETLIAPGEWCMTRLKDGKQIASLHKLISKDGKTMTQRAAGKDAQGKPYQDILVYDKQ